MLDRKNWAEVDAALRRLAAEQCARDHEIGEWLIAAESAQAWKPSGHGSIYEYAERLFGWGYGATCERLRVAKALRELPRMSDELRTGRFTFSVAREVTRVATPETEAEWIDAVQGKTARVVEAKVARHVRGERPSDEGDPKRVRMRMVLEFTSHQWAIVHRRFAEMRKGDPSLTDEELFCALAQVEGGVEGDLAVPPFRIEMRIEPDGKAFMEGGRGEQIEVSEVAVEAAQCDAEVWEHAAGGPLKPVKRRSISAKIQRDLLAAAKGRCEVCGVRLKPHKHHLRTVSEGGGNELSNLILLCSNHHDRVHEGTLIISGDRAAGWVFKHADGTLYGGVAEKAPAPSRVEANSEAFLALRALGYFESEIRAVLAEIRAIAPDLSTGDFVTRALEILRAKHFSTDSIPPSFVREVVEQYRLFPRGNHAANSHVGIREDPRLLN